MALVLAFGAVLLISVSLSGPAARTILSTALMFLVAGALIGQGGLGLVDIPSNSTDASSSAWARTTSCCPSTRWGSGSPTW
ncbi:hypothetical protein [Lentzea sp. CC55]|uniref:hypothetical protein n=1 Tax=Lentzea sp. CC55 TaxID=2884909 RepID=UPI001F354AEF|nr:hypothetical protein [Lentzea sp. CC55]MCG8922844.1 hypothetical protein [Lentzea sp. CC55]